MRRKFGTLLILLGALLILAAAALFLRNHREDAQAGVQAAQVVEKLETLRRSQPAAQPAQLPEDLLDPTMTELEIDGYAYIGYLKLPNMDQSLPIMSDWSNPQLQIAPCRYYGSTKTDDLVLMAHNYARHFGKLKDLSPGEIIQFLDMDDQVWTYEVVTTEVLPPSASQEMTAGEYDLTLFTCTYGGQSRVTLRCDRVLNPAER